MILLTSYYISNNSKRQSEIDQCLINNIKNIFLNKIYLFNNKYYDLDFVNDKITKLFK